MSTKTSTAALESLSPRLLLLQRRVPRHPAGGSMNLKSAKEPTMKTLSVVAKKMRMAMPNRTIRRRLIGALLLGAFSFVVPVIAAASPEPRKIVKVPAIDRRAVENLQRWVNEGHDEWCKDAQMVASAEMRRIAPDFAGYQFDLASLPLQKEAKHADRAVFRYTTMDGRVTYRITLRRYEWLLPTAGSHEAIVWVPARTEIITNN
jgi:hypothetical protein